MCSWCWGFQPVWQQLKKHLSTQLSNKLEVVYVVGGLAADSSAPMPKEMQQALAGTWKRIQQHIPGIQFNDAFWADASTTKPRRSTYLSCRAVLAAKLQNPKLEQSMILGIQKAYYLNAQNPSNLDVLIDVATHIGLHPQQFSQDINSQAIETQLQQQLLLARTLSAQGFPSLVLSAKGQNHAIPLDYNHSHTMQQAIIKIACSDE